MKANGDAIKGSQGTSNSEVPRILTKQRLRVLCASAKMGDTRHYVKLPKPVKMAAIQNVEGSPHPGAIGLVQP